MKKFLIATFLVSSIALTPQTARAQNIVFDFITESATTISAAANLVSSAARSAFTGSWFAKIVADTAANAAKRVAVKSITSSITSWANGGFQGNPTFVVNPDTYFKNIGTEATRLGLAEITKSGGNIFSDTAVQSIVSDFRSAQLPINEKIPFTLGSTVQENICNDSNLSAMAKNAADDVLSGTAYSAKKTELANSLCSGDASKDKNTQQAMVNIYKEDFSAGGGWDSWLALTTECQNEYCIAQKRASAVAQKAEEKKAIAKEETKQGGGYIGIKNCIKYSETAVTEDGIADCVEYETQTPGKLVSDQVKSAISGPADTLKDAHGFTDMAGEILGGVIDGMVGDFMNKGLSGMISAVSGGIKNTGVNSNTSISLTSGTGVLADPSNQIINGGLEGVDKTSLVKMLDDASQTIIKLENVNSYYLSYLENYKQRVENLNACYDSISGINPSFSDGGRVSAGRSFASGAMTNVIQKIDKAKNNVDSYYSAKSLIIKNKPIIKDSKNALDVQNATTEFINGINNKVVPYVGQDTVLKAEFEGEERVMNYYLGPKESECSSMQVEAQNQLNVNW